MSSCVAEDDAWTRQTALEWAVKSAQLDVSTSELVERAEAFTRFLNGEESKDD